MSSKPLLFSVISKKYTISMNYKVFLDFLFIGALVQKTIQKQPSLENTSKV
jgi:hypothetical protein